MPPVIDRIVPMAHVASVRRSLAFYRAIGLEPKNTYTLPDSDEPIWAYLETGSAHFMISAADAPVLAAHQAVLFYLYTSEVEALHQRLSEAGLKPGPLEKPFYSPLGEFRLEDPDGYVIIITHVEETE